MCHDEGMEKNGKGARGVAFRMGSWVGRIWRGVVAVWREVNGDTWLEQWEVLTRERRKAGAERAKKIGEERLRVEEGLWRRTWEARNRELWRMSEFGQECRRKWGWFARLRRDIEAMKAAERKNRREETGAWGPGKIYCRGCGKAWSPGFYEKHVYKDGGRRPGGIPGVIPDYYPFTEGEGWWC
jgi:hypothetical protein